MPRKARNRVKVDAHPNKVISGRAAIPVIDPSDSLWDVAPVGLAILDKYLHVTRANQTFREFSPQTINPYFSPELKSLLRRALKSGQKLINHPLSGRRHLDSARPDRWMISIYPQKAVRGIYRNLILVTQNDTQRRRLEEELRRVQESLPNAMVVSNRDGKILSVNRKTEQLLGYTSAELIGKPFEVLLPHRFHSDHRTLRANFAKDPTARLMGSGRNLAGLHRDGHEIPVEIGLNPIQTSEGLKIVASIVDITERKQAEIKIKESQGRFQRMADAMPVIVFLTGKERGCTYVNNEAIEFFGLPREHMLGLGWLNLVHPDERTKINEAYSQLFESRKPGVLEFRARQSDGDYRWLLTSYRPIVDTNQDFSGYIATATDISASKQAQSEMYRSHLDSHARRVSSVGELASSLAHELNQPLSAILTNAQAALRFLKNNPEDIRPIEEILGDIVSDDKRAGMIIRRVRGFVKKRELEVEPLGLRDVAQGVIELLHGMALERKTRIVEDFALDLPQIRGDLVQLQQVLLNLIINSFDAMSETSEEKRIVMVRTGLADDGFVQISVKDSGRGIPDDRVDRLFQPFFTTKREGIGLGLSIARTIVEAHKGRLWAENDAEGGAMFHVALPACRE